MPGACRIDYQERENASRKLLFMLTGKKAVAEFPSCVWIFLSAFSLRLRISQQRLFATFPGQEWCWCMDQTFIECSWKLSVRLCAACMLKWPFKPWRGQVTQQTWQNLVFPVFSRFSEVFPDFPRFCRAQSDGRPTVHIVHWCAETTVNFKFTPVQAQRHWIWRQLILRLQKMPELDWTHAESVQVAKIWLWQIPGFVRVHSVNQV